MVDRAIKARTPRAASPATDEAGQDAAMLSGLAELAQEMARGFQAQAMAALAAEDLDRARKAEAGFSSLFLGIRRAVALKAKLRRQQEAARHQAETRHSRLQDKKDDRRRALADRVARAIAVVAPEARERLTAGLWDRLTENERIDADLADTALPIETLIRRLGRGIGLADSAIAYGLDPAKVWMPAVAPARDDTDDPEDDDIASSPCCWIDAEDLGLSGQDNYYVRIDTGEVFDDDDKVVMRVPVPDNPRGATAPDDVVRLLKASRADPGGGAPPPPPPDPQPLLDPEEEAEFQRRAAYALRHGVTLIRPPGRSRPS